MGGLKVLPESRFVGRKLHCLLESGNRGLAFTLFEQHFAQGIEHGRLGGL